MVTIKNRYLLPFISEFQDCVKSATIFTRLDLRGAYNLIRVKEGDEYKTAFHTCYSQFEYRVIPFGINNALATFQAYIDKCLTLYLDDFMVRYLDNILIYSRTPEEHEERIKLVLAKLREFGLFCKAGKCVFCTKEVGFFGFVISLEGVGMEGDCVATIEDWPTPKAVRDVHVVLEITNIYRRFIQKYAKVTSPISNLRWMEGNPKWKWTHDVELAFQKLKRLFGEAPILQHFNPAKPIILQTDASRFAIVDIINQYDGLGVLRPMLFYSRTCTPVEQNFDTYDRELLVIFKSLKH